ncbi:MAG: hypothetical protein LBO03_00370 [Acidaminococcales bacterium]|nr:hypothetical protein [Acidaminococcales bacterium]
MGLPGHNGKKKIIILYAPIGSGHAKAASALKRELEAFGGVELVSGDIFDFAPRMFGKLLLRIYMGMLKIWPSSYDFLYKWGDKGSSLALRSVANRLFYAGARRFFEREAPDAVIATHFAPAGVAALYKKESGKNMPLFGVITDYAMHRWWAYDEVDVYIGADKEMFADCRADMKPGRAVWDVGIPIDREFCPACADGKETLRRKLGFARDAFVCVMSGGGEGLLDMREIMAAWRREADKHPRVFFVAVCGKNGRLKNQLSRLALPYLRVLGFVENFAQYIKAADLAISKAGGLTAAEVIAVGLPLIIYRPLPGQEFVNAGRLAERKLALLAKSPEEACRMVIAGSAREKSFMGEIKKNQRALGKPFAAKDAALRICAFLGDK